MFGAYPIPLCWRLPDSWLYRYFVWNPNRTHCMPMSIIYCLVHQQLVAIYITLFTLWFFFFIWLCSTWFFFYVPFCSPRVGLCLLCHVSRIHPESDKCWVCLYGIKELHAVHKCITLSFFLVVFLVSGIFKDDGEHEKDNMPRKKKHYQLQQQLPRW